MRLACTATVAAQAVLAPVPATAAPEPQRSVSQLLTDLQKLYRQTEQATETYDATADRLGRQKSEVARLDKELSRARRALEASRADAGRLAASSTRAPPAASAPMSACCSPRIRSARWTRAMCWANWPANAPIRSTG